MELFTEREANKLIGKEVYPRVSIEVRNNTIRKGLVGRIVDKVKLYNKGYLVRVRWKGQSLTQQEIDFTKGELGEVLVEV